jgi:uncharacterized protein (DUF1800 family)
MLRPLPDQRWNFKMAAHLLNRAGFGGPPSEIERLAVLGPERAVAFLVDYEHVPDATPNPAWAAPDPNREERLRAARQASPEERKKIQREEQQNQRQRMIELRSWWLERMAKGPRPFQEKMVLFWHGHFATSVEKVRDSYLMWRQNELFRRLATGNWLEILIQVAKDPAMLVWLDQAQSRKEHPNENFAREVMELFAMGEGHYTEKDVTEGARALTGWSYDRAGQKFIERPNWHDTGAKVIFGKQGNFNGEDFLELIVAQPQAARFITGGLWKYFAGEEPSNELAGALASSFRLAGNNLKPLMRTMFLSEEFYAPSVIRNQVKSPAQWLVGSVRVLERELPPPAVCLGLMHGLGQDLFAPPNVKGWDGGLSWISTNTLLARYNQSAVLVQGTAPPAATAGKRADPNKTVERAAPEPAIPGQDVAKLFTEAERTSKEALIAALEQRFLQANLKPRQEQALREFLNAGGALNTAVILNAIRLVMSTPDYQLT